MIEVDDPVYAFNEVMRHIDPKKYFVEEGDRKTGRPEYDKETLLKVTLFGFMDGCDIIGLRQQSLDTQGF